MQNHNEDSATPLGLLLVAADKAYALQKRAEAHSKTHSVSRAKWLRLVARAGIQSLAEQYRAVF